MHVRNAIATMRAVRQFDGRAPDQAAVDRILWAGHRSGSAKNLQRWEFIVCRDRQHLIELSRVGPWAGHLAGAPLAIALVTPDPRAPDSPLSIVFDLGQVAAYMMLAAWELGIGSVPATVYDQVLARGLLGYPGTHHCEYLISFGYPADPEVLTRPPRAGYRRAVATLVHDERWSLDGAAGGQPGTPA
jgi:nitroreductase